MDEKNLMSAYLNIWTELNNMTVPSFEKPPNINAPSYCVGVAKRL